ncbi:hypothetical protein LCGC14_0978810 [marine sediment metagenome]|uniref:Uncharacterized protein n=1 Tax=marine sediment metagenome TaxID=412755 RepID=A0A0F9NDU4_9ZZZZ
MSRVTDFIENHSNLIGVFKPVKWYCGCGKEHTLIGNHATDVCGCGKDKHYFGSYYRIHGNEAIVCIPKTDALEAVRFTRKEERFIMLDTGLLGQEAVKEHYSRSFKTSEVELVNKTKAKIFTFMKSGNFHQYYKKVKDHEDVPLMLSRFIEKHFTEEK